MVDNVRTSIRVSYLGKTTWALDGKPTSPDRISTPDLQKVIETEQWLERMTGYRWHIDFATVEGMQG